VRNPHGAAAGSSSACAAATTNSSARTESFSTSTRIAVSAAAISAVLWALSSPEVIFAQEPAKAPAAAKAELKAPEIKAETKPSTAESKPLLDKTPLWTQAWEGHFRAAVHVRYHHYLANLYGERDRITKFALLAAGIAGIAGAWIASFFAIPPFTIRGKTFQLKEHWIKWVIDFVGFIALLASVWLLVYPYSDWRADHKVSYEKWNDLQGKWNALMREYQRLDYDEFSQKVTKLEEEERAVEGSEPFTGDSAKLHDFQEQERTYEGRPKPMVTASARGTNRA
jgi:hypothetical protein